MLQLKSTLALGLSLLVSSTLAKDGELSSDLVGCKEVSCPLEDFEDRCAVGDDVFLGIGLSRIPDVPSSLSGFSLVKGVNVSTPLDGGNSVTRPFRSVYYLGTPPDIEAKDLSGCVVVFHDSPSDVFNGSTVEGSNTGDETRSASGTCFDVIGKTCIEKVTEKATKSVKEAGGNCTTLEQELKKFSLDKCDRFADAGGKLGNFSVKALDDLVAVKNSTNCWPIQPKADQLIEIGSFITLRDYTANAMVEEAWKITPVLTVFTGKGNNSLVDETVSQLTCMKVVTHLAPPPDSYKNSAVAVKVSGFAAGIAVLAGIFAFL
ncbi:hypothetical protein N7517_002438 [Penicillium concentricum]|uniref:Uncharacterized protein n=1 Tax=Penicillium concentricum TaxID=293559 RepID=A0A9W9STT9_9EURO|nr:uncharacterized protein N7517_002438 [Penicillium concentricum]KAJ5384527.1 hypothetical protein N7517_002438 [Penicillium concentricum]